MFNTQSIKLGPAVSLELQARLVDAWAQNCIPQFYQTLFLQYAKKIPAEEAQIIMNEEIKIMRKGNSYIQLFLKTMRDKAKLEEFIVPGTVVQPDLPRLCDCLGKLRELNFKAAHLLHRIRDKYDEQNKVKSEIYFFHRFATRLDQFRKTLSKSKLNRIVSWQTDYDPFYMGVKLLEKSSQEQSRAFQEFLSIAVDDSYRFLKMRKVLVSWIYMQNGSKDKGPLSPPPEQKYIVFPSIKNELLKERSADIQKLKTISVHQDEDFYKQNYSTKNSDMDAREKDSNRTRYLRSKGDTLRTSNRNQSQFLGKSVEQNHLNNFASMPFQLPHRNQRKSEEIGKIRRSGVSQLNKNILSRVSKPRYAESQAKSFTYNTKLDRLETYPETPQKSLNRYKPYIQPSPSKMLTKSLMINIMISPMKYQAQKQPQNRQEAPRYVTSSNITQRPIQTQPRRLIVQTIDFGQQNQRISAVNMGNANNNGLSYPYQSQKSEYASNPQATKRNNVSNLRENNDGVRSTVAIGKEENLSNNRNNNQINMRQTNNNTSLVPQNNQTNTNTNYTNNMHDQTKNQQKNILSAPIKNQQIKQPPKTQCTKQEKLIPPKQTQVMSNNQQNNQQNPLKNDPYKESLQTNKQNSILTETPQQPILSKTPQQNTSTLNQISNQPNNTTNIKSQSAIPSTFSNNHTNTYNQSSNSSIPLNTKLNTNQTTNNIPNQTQSISTNSHQNQNTSQCQNLTNPNISINPSLDTNSNNIQSRNTPSNQNQETNPQPNPHLNIITGPASNLNAVSNQMPSTNNLQSELKPVQTSTVGKEQKREIKIKVGKFTFSTLAEYISTYTTHPQYSSLYDLKKIMRETEVQQSYVIQFLINDKPGALALSSLVPPLNNFAIRLWLIHSSADPSLSSILFKKYVQMVEKYIIAPLIYFKGEKIPELDDSGFQQKKERLYSRQRVSKPREIQRQFQPFLNCECSQVSFPQKQKEDVLYSQQIQKFDTKNSQAADFLFTMQGISGPLSSIIKVDRGLSSFVQVNKLLSQDDIDEYQVNKSITASPIDLLRIAYQSTIKDPFTACEGVFKFFGFEVMVQAQRSIYVVNLSKNNGKMYFGKGFQSIQQFAISIKVDNQKRANICIPMFTKSLYGRYSKVRENQKGFYGNWDFSLVWEDEMQGRVKHSTENSIPFSCPFFVALQLQGNLLYSLQISKDDLLY